MRWLILFVLLVLLDVVVLIVIVAGLAAENCESLRPEASGTDWQCWGVVQALASNGRVVVVVALAITALAAAALAIYDSCREPRSR